MKVLKELVEIYFFFVSVIYSYGMCILVVNLNIFYMFRGFFN